MTHQLLNLFNEHFGKKRKEKKNDPGKNWWPLKALLPETVTGPYYMHFSISNLQLCSKFKRFLLLK
jgi:hypothetical protein